MEKEIEKIITESFSINDLCIKIYGYCNGNTIKKVSKIIKDNNIDISHFGKGKKRIKHERITKICPICNIEFKTNKGDRDEKTTCSHKCSVLYFQHGKNNPDFDEIKYREKYEKVGTSLRGKKRERIYEERRFCKKCNIDISDKPKKRIFCSNKCRSLFPISDDTIKKLRSSAKERITNGTHKGWQSRSLESYPEKFFKKVLINNNIEFEFNKPIKKRDIGIDCDFNYFLDFLIKGTKIDLEIDGKQHKYRVEHDKFRDESLIKNGYDVYRIKWKSINTENGKQYIQQEINKFIQYYMKTIQQQQQQQINLTD